MIGSIRGLAVIITVVILISSGCWTEYQMDQLDGVM